jgi:hypothetical protein
MRALMAGDLGAVQRHAEEAAAIGRRAGSDNADMMVATLRIASCVLADLYPDRIPEISASFNRWMTWLPVGYRWAAAAWFAVAGDTERARAFVTELLPLGIDGLERDAEWLELAWMAGETGRRLGEPAAVEMAYEALQPYADLWVVDGIGAACYGTVSYQLGRLAATLGRRDDAERWLRTALEQHRGAGARLLAGLTEAALAELGTPAPPPTTTPKDAEFRREGRVWRVAWRGQIATVSDSKGMRDLAALLSRPGRELAAVDLVEGAGGPPAAGGDTGPELDSRARAEYRRRLADLEEDLAEAESHADTGRTAALTAERDFLAAELAGAVGLGGRPRMTGDPAERARKAVTMRVGTALKAIAEVHPGLARHLRASVSTGRFCSYQPEEPVAWRM